MVINIIPRPKIITDLRSRADDMKPTDHPPLRASSRNTSFASGAQHARMNVNASNTRSACCERSLTQHVLGSAAMRDEREFYPMFRFKLNTPGLPYHKA